MTQSQIILPNIARQQLIAPVAQQNRHPQTTEKYLTIPSTRLIDAVEASGFPLHQQIHFNTRKPSPYGRHLLKFRYPDESVTISGTIPEILVINGHDGLTALRVMGGLFRFVCETGLILGDTYDKFVMKHRVGALSLDDVVERVAVLANGFIETIDTVAAMQRIQLSLTQKVEFATQAAKLRWYDGNTPFDNAELLKSRREEDTEQDLWTVFNVVQENLIKGFTAQVSPDKQKKIRAIRNTDNDLWINRKLWNIASDRLAAA